MFQRKPLSLTAAATTALALCCGAAAADDRDLLRESSSDPYVFILFDTSGSMHWSPQCTQEQYDAGVCDFLCPAGDCFVPLNGDDPASKLHQAKEALHEVLGAVDGIHFGFATYNQNELVATDKHWLYRVSDTQADGLTANDYLELENGDHFPEVARYCTVTGVACSDDSACSGTGDTCEYDDVFGWTWPCDEGGGFSEAGCHGSSSEIADMNDRAEVRRAQRLPKLGRGPDFSGGGTYEDSFSADSFNGDDGTLSWTTPWIESDSEGAGPTSGNARIESGELRLDDRPYANPDPSLARQADLSGFTSANLTFDYRTSSGVDSSDTIAVEISTNGGGNYSVLEYVNGLSGTRSGSKSYDISGFLSANARIRFRVSQYYGGSNEYFYVDNLVIGPPQSTVFLRNNNDGRRYKLIYRPVAALPDGTANRYGNAKFAVDIEARRCTNNPSGDAGDCTSSPVDRQILYYDLVSDFSSWDNGADRTPPTDGFFRQSSAGDADARDTCDGWDSNSDTAADLFGGYNLRWATDPDPPSLRFDTDADGMKDLEDFPFGDVIPLDWEDDHGEEIAARLAPNLATDASAVPDFRVAAYLADQRLSGQSYLRLKNEAERPLIADGATPLGNSVRSFRKWYRGCTQTSCPAGSGWVSVASTFDRDLNCRKKFLLVLTDGDDTCGGADACNETAKLLEQTGIRTFVVAYGVQGGGNKLTCMAADGGTGDPIYPQNKQELVEALLSLFAEVKAEARAFASASVPTVQNETSDKLFLSSFTPLPGTSTWPGRLDAFRRPLPLKDDNTPDFERGCVSEGLQAGCHLWNAGDVLLDQAPSQADLAGGDLKVGAALDERRIFYGQENLTGQVPAPMRLFTPPADPADELDLWRGLDLPFVLGDAASESAARLQAEGIMKKAVKIKEVSVPDPAGSPVPLEFTYVLGDVFHADPQVIGSPNNLLYFRQDLHDYQAFSRRYFWRRKMLAVAANDGMLHFFDAGSRTEFYDVNLEQDVETFTDGTGRELFAYMPRLVMPVVREQCTGDKHVFSLDGALATADVFIDPLHNGSNNDPDDRGWRTVVIGGLREGGDVFRALNAVSGFTSGYYALDVTQPDKLYQPPPTPDDPDPRPYPALVGGAPPPLPTCVGFDTDGHQTYDTECPTPAGSQFTFPTQLWTFTDQAPASLGGPYALDEEVGGGNGEGDLGDTWSKPVVGRIRVCDGSSCDPTVAPNDLEERFVAVFGGGLEPRNPNSSLRGSWLYMLDVETGRALYKRQVEGAVAATPAVVDQDRDGYFDTVYLATTLGFVYKVDLTALTVSGAVPALEDVTLGNGQIVGSPLAAGQSATVRRVIDPAWEPFKIFSTGGRPLYMPPTTFLVPDLDQIALAFGTGNRHNLWDFNGTEGRFYIFVDEDYTAVSAALPRTEADYTVIDDDDAETTDNLLAGAAGSRGWVLRLNTDEKIITQPFALVGVIVFTAFSPQESADLDGDGAVDACARSGLSRIFVVNAENANAFVDLDGSIGLDRAREIGDFTTSPYVDQTATKNPEDGTGRTTDSQLDQDQSDLQEAIRLSLMKFFPEGCRFNKAYSLTINASKADTGHVRYATIPIAFCAVNWNDP